MHTESEEETTGQWMKEAQKGYIRVAVLILLSKKPHHGYEMMKEIKDKTKGFWKPTAGGVYPILRDLEESGYIEGKWSSQRKRKIKVYKITKTGRIILKGAIVKQGEIANSMNALFQEFAKDVLNIETKAPPLPVIPNLFSPFLEEKDREQENDMENLEQKRAHLRNTIRMLQKELQKTNRKLAKKTPERN